MEPAGSGGTPASGTGGASGSGGAPGTGGAQPQFASISAVAMLTQGPYVCSGPMNLTVLVPPGDITSGSWNCIESAQACTYRRVYIVDSPCVQYGGPVSGNLAASGAASLFLVTEPGFALPVTGTWGPAGIVGIAAFADAQGQFVAR
jgi:hypothetical protein